MPRLLILDDPDPMLMEQIPRTLEKSLGQLMQSGGSILILTRKPLAWAQISASHQLDQGRLRPLPSAARIAVVGDAAGKAAKAKPGGSVTKLVG
jgi:ABC-type protease/lipase transport system fused ATPase/permease subunit